MALAVTKCYLKEDQDWPLSQDDDGRYSYETKYIVVANQKDPVNALVLQLAQAFGTTSLDQVPTRGDRFTYNGAIDYSSFAQQFQMKRIRRAANSSTWEVTVGFRPLASSQTQAQLQTEDPRSWDTEIWVEWVEEQVPITSATCLTALAGAERGPSFPGNEPGPIVNAANQQPIDPLTRPVYRPILNILSNFTNEAAIAARNNSFTDTVNSDTFLGEAAGTWKFLVCAGQRRKSVAVGAATISYYPAITKVEYRKTGWNLNILNNGMVSFRKNGGSYIQDGTDNKLFPILVPAEDAGSDDTVASEPLNLNADGTFTPGVQGNNISYNYLTSTAYAGLLS